MGNYYASTIDENGQNDAVAQQRYKGGVLIDFWDRKDLRDYWLGLASDYKWTPYDTPDDEEPAYPCSYFLDWNDNHMFAVSLKIVDAITKSAGRKKMNLFVEDALSSLLINYDWMLEDASNSDTLAALDLFDRLDADFEATIEAMELIRTSGRMGCLPDLLTYEELIGKAIDAGVSPLIIARRIDLLEMDNETHFADGVPVVDIYNQ